MSCVDTPPDDASDAAEPSNASAVSLAFLSHRGIFFRIVIFKQSLKATFHQSTCRPHTDHSSSTHHSRHVVRHHQHAALRVRQLPEGLHIPERGQELQLHQEVRVGPWGERMLKLPPIPPPIATASVNELTQSSCHPSSSKRWDVRGQPQRELLLDICNNLPIRPPDRRPRLQFIFYLAKTHRITNQY